MRRKTIVGAAALLAAGVCAAVFTNSYEHATWIMLIVGAVLTYVFLKCFSTRELENTITDKLGSRITPIAIVLLVIANILMPSSMGTLAPKAYNYALYLFSYVIWISGLYLLSIKNEAK